MKQIIITLVFLLHSVFVMPSDKNQFFAEKEVDFFVGQFFKFRRDFRSANNMFVGFEKNLTSQEGYYPLYNTCWVKRQDGPNFISDAYCAQANIFLRDLQVALDYKNFESFIVHVPIVRNEYREIITIDLRYGWLEIRETFIANEGYQVGRDDKTGVLVIYEEYEE